MELFTPGHLVVIAIVALVLFFGWKQLPDMARSMGRSLRIFKTEIKGMTQDDKAREADQAAAEPEAPRALPPAQVVPADATRSRDAAPAAEPARPRPRPAPARSAEAPERRADAS